MISVSQALDDIFSLAGVLDPELVSLSKASGRVLAKPAIALRNQPPFASSAMDGYALNADDAQAQTILNVVGESAAGHGYTGTLGPMECVRIFTGAPVPIGTNCVIIQEDVDRSGDKITLNTNGHQGQNIRDLGIDFKVGFTIDAPRLLTSSDIMLLAAMNVSDVWVTKKPDVAIISTGDELVQPGETPNHDQIIASNALGLHALLELNGASPRILPIARDNENSLKSVLNLANSADLIVTIGGASVGDHDLVGSISKALGMQQKFYKVAMRPGKPLMAGTLGNSAMIGLPGNPVSSMVCGHIFMLPLIRKMLGLGQEPASTTPAKLLSSLQENGLREHYMRAHQSPSGVRVFSRQDSSLMNVLSDANCLIKRPPLDSACNIGDTVSIIKL